MPALEIYHVEDWGQFIEENNIDLHCPTCKGEGQVNEENCEECGGSGYMDIMWNTIWNTGYHTDGRQLPAEAQGVAIFEHDGHVWFGLQGCGMDMTPHLAAAWIETFPDCQWLPDQFLGNGTNLRGGYVESCVGKKMARRIYTIIGKTIKGMRQQAAFLAEDLKEARKHLSKKASS
jgi:hypothetical protein